MADEPYENPEHFSFKEKLKRFQNKDIILSDPTKVDRCFHICITKSPSFVYMRRHQAILITCIFLILFLFFAFFNNSNYTSEILPTIVKLMSSYTIILMV